MKELRCPPTTSTKPIDPLDYLEIDTLLSDEERLIRDTVRGWVGEHVLPNVAEWFEDGDLPMSELAPELGKLGLLGMHLEGYGCAGASAVAYGLACLELEAGDSGIRSLVSVQGSLVDVRHLEAGAPRSRSSAGCRGWRPASCSAASA